jgi:hypothetical protein
MSRYLFAWELGGNLGHLTRLVPVARMLARQGHEVLFASRELVDAGETLQANGLRYVAAPAIAFARKPNEPIISYPDLLAAHGFADPRRLAGALGGWLGLLQVYKPDAILLDHAPTALLAARIAKLPHLVLGTGFTVPPAVAPMPSMRPWKPDPPEKLRAAEEGVLGSINRVAKHFGGPGFGKLHELFDPKSTAICAFPELDHYGARKDARYIGPTFVTDGGQALAWRGRGAKVFAYLRMPAVVDSLINVLSGLKADGILYAPGATPAQQKAAKEGGLQLTTQPARLDKLLKEAEVVVSSAGHGLLSAGLLAGVPTLLVPSNVEQLLASRAAKRLGAALFLLPAHVNQKLGDALDKLLGREPQLRAAARAFSGRYTDYSQKRSQETLLGLALGLTGKR